MCLLTEFVDSGDLHTLMRRLGQLVTPWIRFYLAELASALIFLHKHNIIYRDVKPENVCVNGDGHIKLVDFGLSKSFEPGKPKRSYSLVGTVDYMAPEVAARCGHNQSADWWSFGILAFELFYGTLPRRSHPLDSIDLPAKPVLPSTLEELMVSVLIVEPEFRATGEGVKALPFFTQHIKDWDDVDYKGLIPPWIPYKDGRIPHHVDDPPHLIQGRESLPRLKSCLGKAIEPDEQAKFDFFSEYCGYFEHCQSEREAKDRSKRREERVWKEQSTLQLSRTQKNLQTILDMNSNEDETVPSEERHPVRFYC